MQFLDEAKIFIKSGNGGAGCVSFRREANIPHGGPDGGNGGRGGHVIIRVDNNLNTLIDYRYKQHFKAKTGMHGMGKQRNGSKGEDVILNVPPGTQIYDDDQLTLLADMRETGQELILAEGGRGGIGNMHFKTSTNQAPRNATPGEQGVEQWVWLKLKLFCDVGLIGMPNAGKSTLLAALSRAKPKIADYPFTTLNPQLGVVYLHEQSFVMADIPGLIEGAHEGHGLGLRFLKHVERCRVLLHVIDATLEDPVEAYRMIRSELAAYSEELAARPERIALNKCDALDEMEVADIREALAEASGADVFPISGVARTGLETLTGQLYRDVTAQSETQEDI